MLPRLFKTEADILKHQINTLKVFNENVIEITENEEYEIHFTANSGGSFTLKVSLSKDFPKDKPKIRVVPNVVHPWVNGEGEVVAAPGLLSFTVHSDLGRVVQVIIREFQMNQASGGGGAHVVSPMNGEIRSNYPPYTPSMNNFSPPSSSSQHLQPLYNRQVPFPELGALSRSELAFLSENSDQQDEFLEQLPLFQEQNKLMEELMGNIEELAENNLSKKDKLEELRKEVDSRIEEVTKLAFENERLHLVYQTLSDKYAPRNIQDQLRIATTIADQESESVAESFLNGEIDLEKFLSDFIKIKTLSQTRKTKEEKLNQQLDRLERAGF